MDARQLGHERDDQKEASHGGFPPWLRWVQGMLAEHMAERGIPGAAGTVVRDGEIATVICLGVADTRNGLPLTPSSVFPIGALSKTLAGVGLMRLVERGRLGLDDHLADISPDTGVILEDPRATVRHLLTQAPPQATSLRRRYRPHFGHRPSAVPGVGARARRGGWSLLASWERELLTMAELIVSVTGEPFSSYMSSTVLEPLGMHSSIILPFEAGAAHGPSRERPHPASRPSVGIPSAVCSVTDLGRLLQMFTSIDRRTDVLRPETLRTMLSPSAPLPASGLAFWLENLDGHVVAQAGSEAKVPYALCYSAPEAGAGVVLTFVNPAFPPQTRARSVDLAGEILARLLGTRSGISLLGS